MIEQLLQARPAPPGETWVLLASAVLAALLCLPRATWRWFGLVVTVVHELGHALAGLTTGRRVLRIRIEADHSGVTHTFGTSASAVWSTFWGYPFPAVVGAVWAAGAGAGRWPLVAAASAAVLVISLIVMRGWLSWCVTLGTAAALIALLAADPAFGRWIMLAVGTALWVGSLRVWWLLARRQARASLGGRDGGRLRHHPQGLASDAAVLAGATGVPALVWTTVFLLVILTCGAAVLLTWLG